MASTTNIVLIGPMGSGKSAVGRRLAKQLHREFADSDELVEQRTGVDIAYIFEKEGEPGFRKREREVISELSKRRGIVIATGGGAILSARNRSNLSRSGHVVYLHTSVSQQLKRTRRGKERPLITEGDPEAVLTELMTRREPLYRDIADTVVETDGRTVAAVARELRDRLSAETRLSSAG